MDHPVHREVLHRDHLETVNDPTALLMGEVLPPPAGPLVDACDHFPPLLTFFAPFHSLGKFALRTC